MTALDELLAHHGDRDALPGLVDLAVNIRPGTPPQWLRERLASVDLARYPDPGAAVDAIARRHGRAVADVLVTAGAAEAFTLIARAFAPRHAVVVHPQFTEPERALRAAGHDVDHVVLKEPFVLEPRAIPESADLVLVGNPTNPTSVLHAADTLRAIARPGRIVVVDEAFADCIPDERESLASLAVDGVIVVRSLTKTWGLAGLRVGYALAAPELIARLAAAQPHWSASALALEACVACSEPTAVAETTTWANELANVRAQFAAALDALFGLDVVAEPAASFLLVRTTIGLPWLALRDRGFAVRRGNTFPGLSENWMRVAVRDRETSNAFVTALGDLF